MIAQVKAINLSGSQKPHMQNQNQNNQGKKKQQQHQQQQQQQPQQQQQQAQPQQPQQSQQQQNPATDKKKGGDKGNFKKKYISGFVQPWPANCSYLSKNGNMLKPEFESHFRGHCHKCGHSSHRALKCKTYPETTTILTLCERCRQGLHEVCRSKRRDLAPQIDGQAPGQVKTIITTSLPANAWPFAFPPPNYPAQVSSKSDQESDSD